MSNQDLIQPQHNNEDTTSESIELKSISPLLGDVDISDYQDDINSLLKNPQTKAALIKELQENQPIDNTKIVLLDKILQKIEKLNISYSNDQYQNKKQIVQTINDKVIEKKIEVWGIKTEVWGIKTEVWGIKTEVWEMKIEKTNLLKKAQEESEKAFKSISEKLPAGGIKDTISSQIDSQMQGINSGNIPADTQKFLDSIGANNTEAIQSPEIQSVIRTHISTRVYLSNSDAIQRENPSLVNEINTIRTNAPTLGVDTSATPPNIKNILQDIPRSDRNNIISNVNSFTRWEPDTIITRSGDILSWKNREWSQYEIDMAVRPPKLTKSKNGLSVSGSRVDENPESKKLQSEIDNSRFGVKKIGSDISSDLTRIGINQEKFDINQYTPTQLRTLFSGMDLLSDIDNIKKATTPESQKALQETLKTKKEWDIWYLNKVAISYMETILADRIFLWEMWWSWESINSKDLINKLDTLQGLNSSGKIESFAKAKEQLQKNEKELNTITSPGASEFDETAEKTLSDLAILGYNELGQENLDKLIRWLSERDNNRWIWESGSIDMANKITRDAQFADLKWVANQLKQDRRNNPNTKDGNSFWNVFQDIANGIKGNESFRNLWNHPRWIAMWLKKQWSQENTDKLPSNKTESPSPTATPTENK